MIVFVPLNRLYVKKCCWTIIRSATVGAQIDPVDTKLCSSEA